MNGVKPEDLEKDIAGLEMEVLNLQAEINDLPASIAEFRMRLEVIERTLGIKTPRRPVQISN